MAKFTDIVFDGPPEPEDAGRFVEVEDENGRSMNYGKWVKREDGFWVLRITESDYDLVPVFSDGDRGNRILIDIYLRASGHPTWIGSRRTLEQCDLAIRQTAALGKPTGN